MSPTGADGAPITATERRELRTLIRANTKLLEAQIKERESALFADIETKLRQQVVDDRARRDAFDKRMRTAIEACDKRITGLVEEFPDLFGPEGRYDRPRSVNTPTYFSKIGKVDRRREEANARVRSQVFKAKSLIKQRELELLRQVAADALQTDAAREMAANLLTLDELLPNSAEIPELES